MRGEGSLQALLGRDIVKRKRRTETNMGGAATGLERRDAFKSGAPDNPAQSLEHGDGGCQADMVVEIAGRDAVPLAAPPPAPTACPPEPGCVRCPVCSCQLPDEDVRINAHIDKCLSKGEVSKRTQQASIFQFATRAPSVPQHRHHSRPTTSPAVAVAVPPCPPRSSAALAAQAAEAASSILRSAVTNVDLTAASSEDEDAGHAILGNLPCSKSRKVSSSPAQLDFAASTAAANGKPKRHAAPLVSAPGKGASSLHQQQQQQQQQGAEGSPSVSWPSQSSLSSQEQPSVRVRRQTQQHSTPPPSPAKPGGRQSAFKMQAAVGLAARPTNLRCFDCSVVGRQFQKHDTKCQSGQRLVVEWESGNPRDAHALLVLDAHSRLPLGHLPHVVSRHLAPLLKSQQVVVEAIVQEEPLGEREPLLVELQVALQAAAPGASPGAAGRAAAALGRAEAAAAAQLQRQPQAMGERLHANFLAVVDIVEQHDGHLLDQQETGFIASYKALPLPAQCLFLRLFQRKGRLFRLASLAYKEVPDAVAASEQLAAGGLAVIVRAGGIEGDGRTSGSTGASASDEGTDIDAAGNDPSGSEEGLDGSAYGVKATWIELAELLTVPELAAMLAARRLKPSLPAAGNFTAGAAGSIPKNRQQLLAALEAHAAQSPEAHAQLAGCLLQAAGPVVRLAAAACAAVCRLQRLFFLNEGQSLSQFLASDLGVMQYPQYQVHRSGSAFVCRQDLLDYEEALRHAEVLTDAVENGDIEGAEAALQPAWAALDANLHKQARESVHGFLRQFHAGEVYCIMASIGVDLLERRKLYKEAVQRLDMLLGGCFCVGRRGEWWERLAINLKHLGRHQEALERAEAALADEWLTCGFRLALQRRVLFLGKPPWRWKVPPWAQAAKREPPEVRITGRPLNRTTGAKSRFYGLNDEQCSVEELAMQYYASEEGGGWKGMHSEGGIWATLFGLLLWDVLFMPIPDVFRTPFQTAPLDLNTPSFYPTRKEEIEACLARIAAGEGPRMLRRAWEQHQGTMCRGVSWERHSLEELQEVAECVGGAGLAAVCRLLAQDHAGWSGGMPDLLLWRPALRDAKLAEVKGPRDRLSSQQTAWMHALADAGLQAEVLKVVEPEQADKGARKRRR